MRRFPYFLVLALYLLGAVVGPLAHAPHEAGHGNHCEETSVYSCDSHESHSSHIHSDDACAVCRLLPQSKDMLVAQDFFELPQIETVRVEFDSCDILDSVLTAQSYGRAPPISLL